MGGSKPDDSSVLTKERFEVGGFVPRTDAGRGGRASVPGTSRSLKHPNAARGSIPGSLRETKYHLSALRPGQRRPDNAASSHPTRPRWSSFADPDLVPESTDAHFRVWESAWHRQGPFHVRAEGGVADGKPPIHEALL